MKSFQLLLHPLPSNYHDIISNVFHILGNCSPIVMVSLQAFNGQDAFWFALIALLNARLMFSRNLCKGVFSVYHFSLVNRLFKFSSNLLSRGKCRRVLENTSTLGGISYWGVWFMEAKTQFCYWCLMVRFCKMTHLKVSPRDYPSISMTELSYDCGKKFVSSLFSVVQATVML